MGLKLRAAILIDIDVEDFLAAAEIQKELQVEVQRYDQIYVGASIELRERRDRVVAKKAPATRKRRARAGEGIDQQTEPQSS